jgi:hypothetical protein
MTDSADAPDRAGSPPYSSLKLFILKRLLGTGIGVAVTPVTWTGQTFSKSANTAAPLFCPGEGEEKACR